MSEQKAKFRDILNIYSFTCELPGTGEEIEFRPVTTGQLKKLLTYEDETSPILQEIAIDELISSSILTEGYDPDTMYLEDRFYFIIQLRKKSKGEVIELQHECEECKSQTLLKISLDDLKLIEKKENEDKNVNLRNGISVKLKHITRKDQKQIKKSFIKGLTGTQLSAELLTLSSALGIESISTKEHGEEIDLTLGDKKYLIDNLPMSEYEKIRDWYEENFFGIDFKYEIKCYHCEHQTKIDIPMESAFFL